MISLIKNINAKINPEMSQTRMNLKTYGTLSNIFHKLLWLYINSEYNFTFFLTTSVSAEVKQSKQKQERSDVKHRVLSQSWYMITNYSWFPSCLALKTNGNEMLVWQVIGG